MNVFCGEAISHSVELRRSETRAANLSVDQTRRMTKSGRNGDGLFIRGLLSDQHGGRAAYPFPNIFKGGHFHMAPLIAIVVLSVALLAGCVRVDCAQSTTCVVSSTPMTNATVTVPVSAIP